MTLLITGASGFLGANVVEAALTRGLAVLALSPMGLPQATRDSFSSLPGRLTECHLDLSNPPDLRPLLREHGVRLIVNLAAITPEPDADPALASSVIDVNVLAALAQLEAAVDSGVRRFVQASSAGVYGRAVFGAVAPTEDMPGMPVSLYAISKLAAERLALRFGTRHGVDVVCMRITSVFGPWERDTGVRATLSPPLQLARRASRGEPAVLALGGARDWTYAPDVASAILALLEAPRLNHRVFNLSCGETWNVSALATMLMVRFPLFEWRFADSGEQPNLTYFDDLSCIRVPIQNQRLATVFRFQRSVRECLEHYVHWVADHPDSI